jgi:hypothetical protein
MATCRRRARETRLPPSYVRLRTVLPATWLANWFAPRGPDEPAAKPTSSAMPKSIEKQGFPKAVPNSERTTATESRLGAKLIFSSPRNPFYM